jgi:hypothetical protein
MLLISAKGTRGCHVGREAYAHDKQLLALRALEMLAEAEEAGTSEPSPRSGLGKDAADPCVRALAGSAASPEQDR